MNWRSMLAALLAAVVVGGCTSLARSTAEPPGPPEMLAFTMRQYAIRAEFAETQPLIKARNWAGLAALGRKKLEAEPRRGEWWQVAGYGYLNAGDLEAARDCFMRAARLLPEEIGILNLHAATLARLGDARAARQAVERALQTDPTSVVAWNLSGELYATAGRTREAVTAYERALEFDDRDPFAWRALGMLARQRKDTAALEKSIAALKLIYPPFAAELAKAP